MALLALTHVSPRYAGAELRDEARTAFSRTILPRDFDRVEVPLPERGGPVHVRAERGGTTAVASDPTGTVEEIL